MTGFYLYPQPEDNELRDILEKCLEVFLRKDKVFGDIWKTQPIKNILHMIAFKSHRLTGTTDLKVAIEELRDVVVYACMAIWRIEHEIPSNSTEKASEHSEVR